MTTNTLKNSVWIYNRNLDTLFSFGGILISFLFCIICKKYEYLFGIIFWIWVLCFDAPHLFITYTRTYFKKEFYQDKTVFLFSIFFLICPLVFFMEPIKSIPIGKFSLLENFLFWSQLWGFWHIVSQHYGFFALYARKEGANLGKVPITKFIFYFPFSLFYLFFIFFHPFNAKLIGFDVLLTCWQYRFFILALILLVYLLYFQKKLKIYLQKAPKSFYYYLIFLMYYGLVFIFLSEYEPFYKLSKSPTQFFMLTSLMITLPHNLQYLYIVAIYLINGGNQERRLSNVLNPRVILGTLFFSVMICFFGLLSGEFVAMNKNFDDSLGFINYATLAYGLWWGFKLQHYYLDQKIWRFKNNDHLKKAMQVPE